MIPCDQGCYSFHWMVKTNEFPYCSNVAGGHVSLDESDCSGRVPQAWSCGSARAASCPTYRLLKLFLKSGELLLERLEFVP
jgi:hypothetical protein